MKNRYFCQMGYSLVELMIAMALGSFIIAGILQIFSSSKQSYRVQEGQSRVQENARYVLELLGRDVREAGYTGCRAPDKISIFRVGKRIPSFDNNTAISGRWWDQSASVWSAAVPAGIANVAAGTDMITIQKGESCGATLSAPFVTSPPNINISIPATNSCSLSTANGGDATMVSSCSFAHILRVTNVDTSVAPNIITHGNSQNTAGSLCTRYPNSYPAANAGACGAGEDAKYNSSAQLLKFISYTYFIRPGTNGLNALWRLDNTKAISASNPSEMVEGVEDMLITYGIGVAGVANNYVDASTFPTPPAAPVAGQNDWADVISARIDLLFESIDANLTIGGQVYAWDKDRDGNKEELTSSDGRIRRIFSTTITIRNRML